MSVFDAFEKPFFFDVSIPQNAAPAPYMPPAWTGPSDHELGQLVPVQQVVSRTDEVVVVLDAVRLYTNGIDLVFEVICRERLVRRAFRSGTPLLTDDNRNGLRVGYVSSDERCAGEQPTDMATLPRDELGFPHVPVLVPGTSRVSSHRFELRAWCWPLPPPGPMNIYVTWPELGIDETSVTIDVKATSNDWSSAPLFTTVDPGPARSAGTQ